MFSYPMPGTLRLLRISVLLPVFSMLLLGLTTIWQETRFPDPQVILLVVVALLPTVFAWLPWIQHRLETRFLPVALGIYLVCQTLLTSLLQNLGLVRFDIVPVGPIYVVEPGVLLMLPLLLIAWEYGWQGALLASATAGTIHLAAGLVMHWFFPGLNHLAPVTPFLRPDLLYFLPLVVAYLGSLLRRQLHHQHMVQSQLRDYAARAEMVATGRERHRLAEQLQQTVARSLAVLNDQIATVGAVYGIAPDQAAQQLAGLQQQVNAEVQRTQQVIDELQAHPLEDVELVEAIHWRAETFAQRHNVRVDFQTEGEPAALSAEQEIELYHMIDQALNHLAHHRSVRQVDLRLTCVGPMVALTIHDDGAGCHCADGVEHIKTYAQLIGGHACIDNDGEHGNTFALWLPVKREE